MRKNLLQVKLVSKFFGELVGQDNNGNKYYQSKILFSKKQKARKRWVMYAKEANPLAIDVLWYGWLHYTLEDELYKKQRNKSKNILGQANTSLQHEYWNPKSKIK